MFEGWNEYFFMLGSSAAALIGLMFVVVTLTAGRERSQVERGKQLYSSPVVCQLGVVLFLSGAAIAPSMSPHLLGGLSGGLALLGIGMSARSTLGIARGSFGAENSMFDMSWYGIVPMLAYAGLGGAGALVFVRNPWGPSAVAAALMALMLVSIHAEWDLVTFLAPNADTSNDTKDS